MVVRMGLSRYIIRRLLLIIPVIIGVSLIVFTLTRVAGDPVTAYVNEKMTDSQIELVREKYHLNDSIWEQYIAWLQGVLQGDWGWSKTASMPVTDAIAYYLPATFELAVISMVMSIFVGIWLGTKSAIKKNKPFDHTTRVISLFGVSIPVFLLGLMLLLVFYSELHLFPIHGRISDSYIIAGTEPSGMTGFYLVDSLLLGNLPMFADVLWHLILPSLTLSLAIIAIILRVQRNSMLEVLGLDYVKTARAKGLDEKTIINVHARKNALIPTTTIIGLAFGTLLGGAILTESVFAWPGLGKWSASSIEAMDTASIMGFCLLVAFTYVIVNLVVDILYAYLDPRIRLE
ncbi:MAG: ABC transporter permease [Methanomassiliicoccus sp.]|nr:ABC transporter permease [Methanomassiliicoccus sp.]